MQQRCVLRLLDIGSQALLAAIEPDEVAGQASRRLVVAAREVAFGALVLITRALWCVTPTAIPTP